MDHRGAGCKASWATCANLAACGRPSGLGASRGGHKAMHEVSVQWSNAFDSGRWRAIGLSARTTHPAKLSKSWAELAASLWGTLQRERAPFAHCGQSEYNRWGPIYTENSKVVRTGFPSKQEKQKGKPGFLCGPLLLSGPIYTVLGTPLLR